MGAAHVLQVRRPVRRWPGDARCCTFVLVTRPTLQLTSSTAQAAPQRTRCVSAAPLKVTAGTKSLGGRKLRVAVRSN
jgi:hypothetical protein